MREPLIVVWVGLILSLGYVLTRNIAIPIGFHFTWNLFQNSVYGLDVSGENLSTAKMIAPVRKQSIWLGNEFGIESGLFALFAIIPGSVIILIWVKKRYGKIEIADLGKFQCT